MRIGIVGAGAMGRLFGARLALAGHDVVLLDAAQTAIDQLNAEGISLVTDDETERVTPRASRAEAETGAFDMLFVFTKGFHTRAAVDSVRHLVGPGTIGVTLQNGLGNAEVLVELFGRDHTVAGVTDYPADLSADGVIHTVRGGSVRLGPVGASSAATTVAVALTAAGMTAHVIDDPMVAVWEKVAFNSALNTLSAVTGCTVGELGRSQHARDIVTAVLHETAAAAAAQGIHIDINHVAATVDNAFAHHGEHKTSMLVDLEAGRVTEIDHIGGAVVAAGEGARVELPVLRTLCELVRIVSTTGRDRDTGSLRGREGRSEPMG